MKDYASLSLSVPAKPETLPVVRDLLGCFARSIGADDEGVDAIKLAAHEAAANVVEHAYDEAIGELQVKARAKNGELTIVVSDTTTVVIADSNGHSPQLPGGTDENGRGIPIIERLAAELEVRRSEGTHAEMTFGLPSRAATPVAAEL